LTDELQQTGNTVELLSNQVIN